MSTDGQESRGDMPTEPGRCECGHLVTFHAIDRKGLRAKCVRTDCSCRLFIAVGAVSR